jgi:hypothetical protein
VLADSNLSGWIVLALLAPGLIVLIGVVAMYLLRKPGSDDLSAHAPGYYHVIGVDSESGKRREATFHADSAAGARGRARLEGIVALEIRQIDASD